jgi:flagellar biosynthesis protein FlhF
MLAEFGDDLAGFFARRQDIDTHLVLTAAMRPQDLRTIADRFMPFRPSALLFTRLDETTSMASVASEAIRLKLPLSFFAAGPSVPEDLTPADKAHVTGALVSQLPNELQAVA